MPKPSAATPALCIIGPALLCAALSGCGQTGNLYLLMPPTSLPPLQQGGVPAPSAVTIAQALCVTLPPDERGAALGQVPYAFDGGRNAAPAPGTSVEQIPYDADVVLLEPAPSSLTEILPVCAVIPAQKPDKQP